MKGITIATFISIHECENKDFFGLIRFLKRYFEIETIVFNEKELSTELKEHENIKEYITPNMTKYKRIQILLNKAKFENILCIDNDIVPDKLEIVNFIQECLSTDYSIAWGKIKAQKIRGFIPKLINIDKNLSHNYIRPMLWKLNIGISLPGQLFMINRKYLEGQLPNIDTVYDDLMIGAIVHANNFPVYFTKEVLGYENPKRNIIELLKQRIRWAKGLAETIFYNRKNKSLPYIFIHGFSFNLLWIPIYLIIFQIFMANLICGLIAITFIIYLLSNKKPKNIIWAIIYMVVFPFVYFVWGCSLFLNLIIIAINNNKKIVNKKSKTKYFNIIIKD